MNNVHKLMLAPTAGFSPQIGILVATMQRCRETTIRWVSEPVTNLCGRNSVMV